MIDGSCYVRGCVSQIAPPPNPVFFCEKHLRAARSTTSIVRGVVEWGACLAGCTGFCEKGKWRTRNKGEREFIQSNECEHVPAHLLRIARKSAK